MTAYHTLVWFWDDSDGVCPQRVTCRLGECFPDETDETLADYAREIEAHGYIKVGGGAAPIAAIYKA